MDSKVTTRVRVHNFSISLDGYGAGPDQGSPDVHLVDMLGGHCGASPTITWRVFTGEEPGFWTGVGRF